MTHLLSAIETPRNRWHLLPWFAAALLLLAPWVAMRFTTEVNWTGFDFAVFGVMLSLACGSYEVAIRLTRNCAYRAAVAIAVLAAFLLVWINLAVGIIGPESNPQNILFFGVLGVGLALAALVRFQASRMPRALIAMSATQLFVAIVSGSHAPELWLLTAVFCGLWLGSAYLFHHASRTMPNR